MATPEEPDFPPGHPARFDFDPDSPEAKEWMRKHAWAAGERDYPVGHPKAVDTPGNLNGVQHQAGVDPAHPELEPFTGRTPAAAAKVREMWKLLGEQAKPSPTPEPTEAPAPPKNPGDTRPPTGQPGLIDRLLGR